MTWQRTLTAERFDILFLTKSLIKDFKKEKNGQDLNVECKLNVGKVLERPFGLLDLIFDKTIRSLVTAYFGKETR